MNLAFKANGQATIAVLAFLLVGCEMSVGSADEAALNPTLFDVAVPDIGLPDIRPDDIEPDLPLVPPDIGPVDDSSSQQELETKTDATYLVPSSISKKTHLSMADGRAAWVDQETEDSLPTIVVWDFAQEEAPQTLTIPYVKDPTSLILDKGWLFYVDVPWGSQDVFGYRLSDGDWRIIAGGPGAQLLGDAQNGRVLYTDCSACIAGSDTESASEVYEVHADDETKPLRLSNNKVHDASPVFGTMSDGSSAVAWISNYNTLQVLNGDTLSNVTVDAAWVQDLVLVQGRVSWRPSPAIINPDSMIPSPMIINPDSMMPSDLFVTDIVGGTTSPLSSHAEVGPSTPLSLKGSSSLLLFAEGVVGSERERLNVYNLVTSEPVLALEEPAISGFSIGTDYVGFTAPRPDNEGLGDVWILKL